MRIHRRQFLRVGGLAIAGVLAGCSGSDGTGSDGEATTDAPSTDAPATTETTDTTETTATTEEPTTEGPTTGATGAASTTSATASGEESASVERSATSEGSTGNSSGGTNSTSEGNSSEAAIDEWLADTSNYGGSVEDATDNDSVEVMVGAEGNGGNFAFAPPAIEVSPGTTVTWAWTGGEVAHNVVASEGAFDSGEPQAGGDVTFEHTFEDTGTFLYFCNPHRSLGMKGAVVVA